MTSTLSGPERNNCSSWARSFRIPGLFELSRLISLAFLAFILLGPSPGLAQPDDATGDLSWTSDNPRFISGKIDVPENHDEPDGKMIEIAYVVIKAKDTTSNFHPIVLFSGGPGGNTIGQGTAQFLSDHPFTEKQDFILFDQRGIGHSSPMPDMSFDSFKIMAKDATEEEELQLTKELIRDYKKQCSNLGINPANYNTYQNARDVGVLFKHLGYEKYNLFGGSYGTRIARVVQDLFPEYVHSAVLDSPSPLSGDFLLQRFENYSKALTRIFEYCELNEGCNEQYPDLRSDYFKAISLLQQRPVKVTLKDSSDFYINAQDGIYLLRRLLYQDDSREKAPEMIQALIKGEGEILERVLGFEQMLTGSLNSTMLLSVERFENFNNSNTSEVISKEYSKYPLLPTRLGYFDAMYQAGMEWHEGYLPLEKRKFEQSDIPSMVFVNQFDPVTPPVNGHLFKEQLSNCQLFVLDEGGHGGGNQDCKTRIMLDFMQDPTASLDTSCLNLYER